ncbi:hypothetical protein KQX54_014121 [Cotesia glomerata]|uniref:Ankyrin repeat protein n=1 Tax=Cotesia glomerata TaxID=32391 RepID=A0AAV7IDR1_COTGL|nr:hypothetical protein KQX54_014121 [Cotesia glomerata]
MQFKMTYISCSSKYLDKLLRFDPNYILKLNITTSEDLIENKSIDINTVIIYGTSTGRVIVLTLLSIAVMNKDEEQVNYLLSKNADVNLGTDTVGLSSVHRALTSGSWRIFLKLISHGAALDQDFKVLKCPTIHIAIEMGSYQAVKHLIDAGVNVNVKYNNVTPLEAAVSLGHMDIIKILINNGADKDAKGTGVILGKALTKAILRGQEKIRDFYLNCGAHINYRLSNERGKESILHRIVQLGNFETFKFLLNFNEIDINATTEENYSALHVALAQNHPIDPRIVYKLLSAGININLESRNKKLALHCVNKCNNSLYLSLGKHIVKLIAAGFYVCPGNFRAGVSAVWRDDLLQASESFTKDRIAGKGEYFRFYFT